jgi:hypothetical protein
MLARLSVDLRGLTLESATMLDSENEPEVKPALEWLSERYPDSPRKRLKDWFAKGRIQLDGVVIKKPHEQITDPGDRLSMGGTLPPVFFRHLPTRIHAQPQRRPRPHKEPGSLHCTTAQSKDLELQGWLVSAPT